MRKKQSNYLDVEAMKIGYNRMLKELQTQLNDGNHTEPIKAVLSDRKAHIESRLKDFLPKEAAQ